MGEAKELPSVPIGPGDRARRSRKRLEPPPLPFKPIGANSDGVFDSLPIPDQPGTAATQVSALFGAATPGSFSVSGESVSFTGSPSDWGLRRMVLHYAHLCAAAGGVDAFLIGTEMPGLTTIRSGASTYPAVTAFKTLAADVSTILGAGTKIGYAADWSEYFGHHPQDGSGDVYFHLDTLWSDANIDFVGIDNYLPLSDWRDDFDHADALEGWPAIYDRAYLQANIAGGEGFDWFYASTADRSAQIRTAITDDAAGKPWVFRPKDIRAWWTNPHFNRPGGVESGLATTWVPQFKPIRFTELGCPAIDRGTNQPNVFFDPKSSEKGCRGQGEHRAADSTQGRTGADAGPSRGRQDCRLPRGRSFGHPCERPGGPCRVRTPDRGRRMSSGPTVAIYALAAQAEIAGLALVGRGAAPGWLECHWGGGHPVCAPRRLKPGPGPVWANLVAPCNCNPPITAPNVVSGSALPFAGNRPKCPRHPDMTMPPRAVRRGGIVFG